MHVRVLRQKRRTRVQQPNPVKSKQIKNAIAIQDIVCVHVEQMMCREKMSQKTKTKEEEDEYVKMEGTRKQNQISECNSKKYRIVVVIIKIKEKNG